MALWRTRTLTPDQKAQIAEEQEDQDWKSIMLEDTGSSMVADDTEMKKIYSAELHGSMKLVMEIFEGGNFEHKVMEKSGCLNYLTTSWEPVGPHVFERHLSYRFNRRVSVFGGEVTCTQQKCCIENKKGWIVNEIMSLHDVPFGDYFRVQFKYQIERSIGVNSCKCEVYVGVTWLKNTKFQQRITRNVTDKFTHRFKEIFELLNTDFSVSSR